jgi:hypothetical protein
MTRVPIGLSIPHRVTPEEDEAFNDIERTSKVKQEYVRSMQSVTKDQLIAEVALLTNLVRDLSNKVTALENQLKENK